MNHFRDIADLANAIEETTPEIWKILYPRSYQVPGGYPSPRHHSAAMMAHLKTGQREMLRKDLGMGPIRLNKTLVDYLVCDYALIDHEVPTYFIAEDLLTALSLTDPPADMKLQELRWADNAMLFVLPEKFHTKFYPSGKVPFIRVAKIPMGPRMASQRVQTVCGQSRPVGLAYEGDFGFVCTIALFLETGGMVDYSACFRMDDLVGKIMESGALDWDRSELEDLEREKKEMVEEGYGEFGKISLEEDVAIIKKALSLAIHTIIALSALPQYLEKESIIIPERVKKGKVRKALWKPKIFGGSYVLKKERNDNGGTHASPRLHRRRGHWRRQIGWRYLPPDVKPETTWIEPFWVGAKLNEPK